MTGARKTGASTNLARRIFRRVGRSVVRGLAKLGVDPVVTRTVHGANMRLPLSHMLPHYVAVHPYYDTALPALVKFLARHSSGKQPIHVVDVGANVGDTAVLIAHSCDKEHVSFTCVEADESYLPLLRENTKHLQATIHPVIAAAETTAVQADIIRSGGTSSLVSGHGAKRRSLRLDDLDEVKGAALIKTDTDGYEFEVLQGLKETLTRSAPPVFLEFAPHLLKEYGKVDPNAVLGILKDSGYHHAIVWDHTGYPMMLAELSDDICHSLICYCLLKPGFYVDILVSKDVLMLRAFHDHIVEQMGVGLSRG